MNQEEFLGLATAAQNKNSVYCLTCLRLWLAYLFEMYEVAADMIETLLELPSLSSGHRIRGTSIVIETFYTCLVAINMERRGDDRRRWRVIIDYTLQKMIRWEHHSSWNFQHRVELLQAEIAFLDNDRESAAKLFDRAIHNAGKHGFLSEKALALDRAGLFSLKLDNKITAREYFIRSKELYVSWGATGKANHISRRLDELIA